MRKSRDLIVREDQRKHKRFKAPGEIFAAFVIPNEPIIVGKVLDVSLSGASVQYLAIKKLATGPACIKIFGLNSLQMDRIESTVLYDLEVQEESWSNPKVRRCGIKFEEHGSWIKEQLKELFKINSRCFNTKRSLSSTSQRNRNVPRPKNRAPFNPAGDRFPEFV